MESDKITLDSAELWSDQCALRYDPEDCARIAQAEQLMRQHCAGRVMETGEPEIEHRLATAQTLVDLRLDAETLCAALLQTVLGPTQHDDQETTDQDANLSDIQQECGQAVAHMVADLARIAQLTSLEQLGRDEGPESQENLRRLLLDLAEDVRVVLVVLADRLQVMRAAKTLPDAQRRHLARETQGLYAPLANRLGVWQIKWELEDLSLRYLRPDEYQAIARALRDRRVERQDYIQRVIAILNAEFAKAGIKASISGRPKHIYSIWRKMQRKAVDLDQIFDLLAVRVMVEDIPACYTALGIVHGLWPHIAKEFDDYIATPKGNFYQSLHTAVLGPEDRPLEVQIRTYRMHEHAELGVAAHWAYKETGGQDPEFHRRIVAMRSWLEQSQEGQEPGDGPPLPDAGTASAHVYVLTPQGRVIELPKGATPLDFAYSIHSEVGHRCRGARVDGRIVPLTYPLTSGETVEILTQKNAKPSRDWLSPHRGYLATNRARNRVRQWFKQQDHEQHVAEGRAQLDKELARMGIEIKPALDELAPRYNLRSGENLLAAMGRGDVAVGQIARLVGPPRAEPEPEFESAESSQLKTTRKGKTASTEDAQVMVEGERDLMTRTATCCRPVPPDPVVGFVTRGRGVMIHRSDCPNILNLSEAEQARLLNVSWAEQGLETAYPVDLTVIANDRKGLLRDVSSALSDADADVLGTRTLSDRDQDCARMRFTIEVRDAAQLDLAITKIRQLPDVLEVYRSN